MKYINTRSFVNKHVNRLEIRGKRTRLLSRPVHISLEPTLQCNSNCIMCNRNAVRGEEVKRGGFLSWSVVEALQPFLRWSETVLFGGFGEPLLHPEYVPMLRYIKKQGPEVYFFTNGLLLTPEIAKGLLDAGVDQVSVSFGGASPETYKRIRGVDMAGIVKNLKDFNTLRKEHPASKTRVHLNIVAMNSVLKELEEIVSLASELGIEEIALPNLSVQRDDLSHESPWNDLDNARRLLSSAEEQARTHGIRLVPPDLTIKQAMCYQLFKSITVTWDGLVLSCPLERYIVGDVKETTVQGIWNNGAMVELRRKTLDKGMENVCPNCLCWDNRPGAFLKPNPNSREFAEDLRAIDS